MSQKQKLIGVQIHDLSAMKREQFRVESFKDWPFTEDCKCTPEGMAKAGFYHCSEQEPDLAKCYYCDKELDGWQPTDDPWEEHKSHSSNCPYVLLGKTEAEMTVDDFLTLERDRAVYQIKKKAADLEAALVKQSEKVRKDISDME